MTKKGITGLILRSLGDAAIETPVTTIDPSSEIIFAAALYLLLERRKPVSRRTLQAVLWPDASDRSAAHRLRQTLLKLRRIGFPIETAGKGQVSLATVAVRVDYEEFLATRNGLEGSGNDALVLFPAYEPRFSERYLDWLDTWKADVNASMTRVMLGIIARHRVKGEWVDAERNASKLLRFQPYNEEATLAMAEACAMRGGKLQAMEILDKYLTEVGSGPTDLRLPATIMRRRIADRMHPRMEAAVGQSPLVGRGAVMEQLGELLQRSRDGKGQSCLVWGDAGVGKSRLLAEFATFASLQGIQTQRVQCRPNDRHRPLSAFVDLVPGLRTMRGAIGCSPETFSYLDRLTKQKPAIVEGRTIESDAEIVYAGIQQSLFDLIDAVSDEGCLIVMIEDVHWLDSTSAKLLREMVAWAIDHSIFFAFTGRDRPEDWSRMPEGLTEIHLPPLDAGASRDVILGVVRQHGRELDGKHLEWCVRVAEGNPYFLQELANHWLETGNQNEIPSSLAAVLNERISRLGAEALLLLQTCALLETNATLDRIEKLTGLEPHRLLPAINELGLAGMVVIEADDRGKFSADRLLSRHDLLSNAALSRLTPPARAFLHRRAGTVFEAELDKEQSASTLWVCAKHWKLAGNVDRAFELAKSCATHLLEVGLPSAAAEAHQKTLGYCTRPEQTLQILEGQAHAYYRSRAWDRVSEVFEKAQGIRRKTDLIHNLHDDLELMALRSEWSNRRYDQTVKKTLSCLNAADATPRHRVAAGAMSLMLLDELCQYDGMPSVYQLIEKVVESADLTSAERLLPALVYHTTYGDLSKGVASARALVNEHRKTGNVGDFFRALLNAVVPLRTFGLFDEAEEVLLEAFSVAQHYKIRAGTAETVTYLANLSLERGRIDDARQWYVIAVAHATATTDKQFAIEREGIGVRLTLLGDDPSEARKLLPGSGLSLRHNPMIFHRTYRCSLYLAAEMACGRVPNSRLVDILEESHLMARRAKYQAFPTFVLYESLKAIGRENRASQLLDEYVTTFRRECYPPPIHLLSSLERFSPLTRKKGNRGRSLPALLPSDSGT